MTNLTILVLSGDRAESQRLTGALCATGHRARFGSSTHELERGDVPDLVIVDAALSEAARILEVATAGGLGTLVLGHPDQRSLFSGASAFLGRPFSLEAFREAVVRAAARTDSTLPAQPPRETSSPLSAIVGEHPRIAAVRERIQAISSAAGGTVLITGETGTGKNLVARTIHETSPRREAPFIEVNCAALPENLLESELFGYEKGAFTGAVTSKKGLLEAASSGTLFLDEINSMSLATQVRLLSFLESRQVRPIGGIKSRTVDTRVICATNADLRQCVAKGTFREDLYYRVNVIELQLPPLRTLGSDVVLIARQLLSGAAREASLPEKELSYDACLALLAHSWAGNVRELRNVIMRGLVYSRGPEITAKDLGLPPRALLGTPQPAKTPFTLEELIPIEELERRYLAHALDQMNGSSYAAVASVLGISEKTFYRKRQTYGLN